MTHDTLHRLAEADPARDLDPPPSEELLRQLVASPRAPARRGRRRLRVAAVAVAVIAAVVAVSVAIDPRRSTSLDLAARAYAQTAPAPGDIVYTRVALVRTETTPRARRRETGTIEEWRRGAEVHRLETWISQRGTRTALDHVIGRDGVMRQVTGDGGYRIVRKSDNADASTVIASEQAGFVAEFRRRYEQGRLDESGDVAFAGRPARRYVVDLASQGPVSPRQAYYLDRETGAPLGFTSTMRMQVSDGRGTVTPTTMRVVQTVRAIERLEPTAENLRKLRTHSLPRRRDADGCVRGPVTDARPSDTAKRTDCGGTPGAPVRVTPGPESGATP